MYYYCLPLLCWLSNVSKIQDFWELTSVDLGLKSGQKELVLAEQ